MASAASVLRSYLCVVLTLVAAMVCQKDLLESEHTMSPGVHRFLPLKLRLLLDPFVTVSTPGSILRVWQCSLFVAKAPLRVQTFSVRGG